MKVAQRLELSADRHWHLVAGRIAVRQSEYPHGSAITRCIAGHLIEQGVGYLAGRQVEIGVVVFGDRQQDFRQRRFLSEDHEMVGLPAFNIPSKDHWLDVARPGQLDIQTARRDVRARLLRMRR